MTTEGLINREHGRWMTMLAVEFAENQVQLVRRPRPAPGHNEVLVAVRSAGINGADLLQRAGKYPPPPGATDVPGLEFAGEVLEVGRAVREVSVGDRVMSIAVGGGQATMIVAHERMLIPVPEEATWEEAGGFMETFTTAFDALFTQAGLRPGEKLLINGANGGVGTAALQLAAVSGATVIASSRSIATHERLAKMGAHKTVVPESVQQEGPFDVILELVGAPNMAGNVSSLAEGGRVCVIGVGGGAKTDLNLLALMSARGRIHGSTLRSRSIEQRITAVRALGRHVVPLWSGGQVVVPVEASYHLKQAPAAYDHFSKPGKVGKVVLTT